MSPSKVIPFPVHRMQPGHVAAVRHIIEGEVELDMDGERVHCAYVDNEDVNEMLFRFGGGRVRLVVEQLPNIKGMAAPTTERR